MLCLSRTKISVLHLTALIVVLLLPFHRISATVRLTATEAASRRDRASIHKEMSNSRIIPSPAHPFRRRLEEDEDTDSNEEDSNSNSESRKSGTKPQQGIMKAGADKAKFQFKLIDRFSTERMKQLREHLRVKEKGSNAAAQAMLRHQNTKQQNQDEQSPLFHHDVMTEKMKLHTPGTPQFDARQKSLLDHIEQHNKKQKKKKQNDQQPPLSNMLQKDSLPFHKDVSKGHDTILHRTVAKLPGLNKLLFKMTLEEEMILDASVSFYVHLETSIYKTQGGKLMTEDEIVALSDWLDLVSLFLPPEWNLHKLVDALKNRFEYVAEGMDNMRTILQEHRLRKKMWSPACTIDRGGPFHVGFDCGFWKLLHIITLGVAEQRGGMNLVESGMVSADTKTYSPSEAADVIRNMLQHYYLHGQDFVEAYDDCQNHRRCDRLTEEKEDATIGDWKELALWLWEVHNEISVKILKEKKMKKKLFATAPVELTAAEEIVVLWPTVEECYLCFGEDGTWNENEVFNHLEEHYWYVRRHFVP